MWIVQNTSPLPVQYLGNWVKKDGFLKLKLTPVHSWFQSPPAKQSRTVEGQSITINCKTFGAPKPIIKWYRNEMELTGERFEMSKDGNLIIK